MTLVIFLIDNTPSMLQRTNIDGKYVSWLEVAKQAVKLFFARVVEKNIKEVRYMMLTYDAPPDHVKVGFNETYAQLVEALRTLECTGTQSVHRALQNLFELLNQERMMMGVDTYGHGRCPFYHMYTFIVLISKNYQRQQMSSTFLPLPRGAPGALLTKEPFRWDQRLFALILQYSSDDPNETKDSAISKYGTGLDLAAIDAMCQSTGGWSCLIRSPSHLLYHVQMVIECMKKKLIIELTITNNSLGIYHSFKCAITASCESKSKGWWPFPEPGWVSSELVPRDAHPKLHVLAPRSEEPKWIPNFPVDKYELDMCSALCQHTLFTSACGMVWPVVVTSGSQTAKQLPFGYLKKTCSKVLLYVLPYNYDELNRLLDNNRSYFEGHVPITFTSDMICYLNSIPPYYFFYLRRALQNILSDYTLNVLLPERSNNILDPKVHQDLNEARAEAKRRRMKLCDHVARQVARKAPVETVQLAPELRLERLIEKHPTLQERREGMIYKLGETIVVPQTGPSATAVEHRRNPYKLPRKNLLTVLNIMRDEFYSSPNIPSKSQGPAMLKSIEPVGKPVLKDKARKDVIREIRLKKLALNRRKTD